MGLRKTLLSRRRWMLWLPLPVAAVLAASGGNFCADYIPMLGGGLIFWIPFWLAWWLSNGFSTLRLGAPGGRPSIEGSSADSAGGYWNYAEGHYQNYQGPSSYRL